ncbi:chemotaxis protein CheW [Cryobacterium sp. PH31-AA6]|uniref:chemotaxis protein CheW n=1 Tax=Cryobacterium sp. PH31-AA6 TaxID=3046205 RepID=UPI0024B9C6DF|nr:chemotaxis protein CheW [Cryobacterium sp. PH31-AA6]MDJ0324790.1 chemotaxis protein CheW [Cryobacterium sp. PH31-AA6]
MTTMVCFHAAGAAYCLPVEATRAVRTAEGLIPVPGSSADIAGVLPGDPPLTVLSALGGGGSQVIVVESRGKPFGLLVDVVSGLHRFADDEVGPAPTGQDPSYICGLVDVDGELVLVADPEALAARL